jgi:hypothetical protein
MLPTLRRFFGVGQFFVAVVVAALLDELAGFRQGGFVAEEAGTVKVDVRQLRRMGPRSAICHAAPKSARAPSASPSRNCVHFLLTEKCTPVIGAGLSLLRSSSLDLIYHHYRLVEPAPFLCDARLEDTLTGEHRDLGTEIDVVLALESGSGSSSSSSPQRSGQSARSARKKVRGATEASSPCGLPSELLGLHALTGRQKEIFGTGP